MSFKTGPGLYLFRRSKTCGMRGRPSLISRKAHQKSGSWIMRAGRSTKAPSPLLLEVPHGLRDLVAPALLALVGLLLLRRVAAHSIVRTAREQNMRHRLAD